MWPASDWELGEVMGQIRRDLSLDFVRSNALLRSRQDRAGRRRGQGRRPAEGPGGPGGGGQEERADGALPGACAGPGGRQGR